MHKSIIELWSTVVAPPPPRVAPVSLDPKSTALLMLDFVCQACNEKLRPRCIETIPNARKLLTEARAHGVAVIYAIGSVTPGRSIDDTLPEVAPLPSEPYVQSGPDKFLGTDLEKMLKLRKVKTVIVAGTAAHGAVLHTADAAVFRGFKVVVPVDVISAEDLYLEQYVVHHFTRGSRVSHATTLTTTEMIRFELNSP